MGSSDRVQLSNQLLQRPARPRKQKEPPAGARGSEDSIVGCDRRAIRPNPNLIPISDWPSYWSSWAAVNTAMQPCVSLPPAWEQTVRPAVLGMGDVHLIKDWIGCDRVSSPVRRGERIWQACDYALVGRNPLFPASVNNTKLLRSGPTRPRKKVVIVTVIEPDFVGTILVLNCRNNVTMRPAAAKLLPRSLLIATSTAPSSTTKPGCWANAPLQPAWCDRTGRRRPHCCAGVAPQGGKRRIANRLTRFERPNLPAIRSAACLSSRRPPCLLARR